MVTNDILVRTKWVEWGNFNKEWANRSFEDLEKWLEYKDKLVSEVIDNGVKWGIFINHKEEQSISFTKQFRLYYKPIMKFLLEANEKTLASYDYKPVDAFIEYGFVQIIAGYIGIEGKDFFNLPRKDPNKLRQIFELSEMVFRLLDSDISPKTWKMREEQQEEMIKERQEFKDNINKK